MRAYDLILKKRNGGSLTEAEIQFLISSYVAGKVTDYQMAAWAMAVYFRGMDPQEVAWLTQAMVDSGERVDLSSIQGVKVDKHSTGGVGDTTTLILGPLVAAAGVPVAKMSGRGLGHTGGTLDKLESFSGLQIELDKSRFIDNVNEIKLAVIGQTAAIAPADGLLYSLRDATATVDSIPLIASSIMSKKIAAGADALVLDVKVGNGAFMQTIEEARELAQTMVDIGESLGRRTLAVLTAMDRPLGRAVGNALEVKEAIQVLRGEGPQDLRELCLELGSRMLVLAGAEGELAAARQRLEGLLATGRALDKLKEMVAAQGGDVTQVEEPQRLPAAALQEEVLAQTPGWVTRVDTQGLGAAAMALGAGRAKKGDSIDLAVGLEVLVKPGALVEKGQPLAIIHGNDPAKVQAAKSAVLACYEFGQSQVEPLPLICGSVGSIK